MYQNNEDSLFEEIGLIGKIKKFIFSKITMDFLLIQLRGSFRESDYFTDKCSGINNEQLYIYRAMTEHMTSEEKRNPQYINESRLEELSQKSQVNSYHIQTLIVIFNMRYRMDGFRNLSIEQEMLGTLHHISWRRMSDEQDDLPFQ